LFILFIITLCVGVLSTWLTDTVIKESEIHNAIVPTEETMAIAQAKLNHQSVLVVPFESSSPSVVPAYFQGVVHDELLQSMTANPGLSPISLRAASTVRPEEDLANLRQRLGVRWVVEGRFSQGNGAGAVVATMALSDTLSSETVWSGTIEGNSGDLLTFQSRMQRRLLAALTLWVPGAKVSGSPAIKTSSVEAFEAFLRGVALARDDLSPSNLDASIRFLQKARQLDPGFNDAAAYLCKMYVRRYEQSLDLSDFDQARANCDLVANGVSEDLLAGLSIARMYLTAGRLDKTEAILRKLAMKRPAYPELLVLKARLAAARGDYGLAGAIFRKAIAAEPGFAGNYHDYGVVLFQQGDFDGAFEQFSKELTLQPESPGSWNSLGAIFFFKGQYADAENAYRRSVELEPTAGSYSNLAALYFSQRRFSDAARSFRQAINLNPADPRMWLNWGDALYYTAGAEQQKEAAYAQAALLLREWLALHPGELDKSAMLMHVEAAREHCEQALDVLDHVPANAAWTHDTAYFKTIAQIRCSEPAVAEAAIRHLMALGYPPQALMQDIQFDAYRPLITDAMSVADQRKGKSP
jgi:Flp pilus assembly protein TadD/TolB-like protein